MQRYHMMEQLGDGTYGSVIKAVNKETGKVVAIKRLKRKFHTWNESVSLRELQSLRTLSRHPHIVQVYEVVRESDSSLHFVFEYMPDGNLYELIKRYTPGKSLTKKTPSGTEQVPLGEHRIRSITSQVLSGLSYMHSKGYFHRDIKPENLLLHGDACKVADFGLAREIRSLPPYTDYVSTRWYRAPEVLLRSPRYGPPVDIFAIGCIIAELYTLSPLFPGQSEPDQIYKIVSILGVPTAKTWPEGLQLARRMHFRFPNILPEGTVQPKRAEQHGGQSVPRKRKPLEEMVPNAPPAALELMNDLLKWDPKCRPCASESLKYKYFTENGSNTNTSDMRRMDGRGNSTLPASSQQAFHLQQCNGGNNSSPDCLTDTKGGSQDILQQKDDSIDGDGVGICGANSQPTRHNGLVQRLNVQNSKTDDSNYTMEVVNGRRHPQEAAYSSSSFGAPQFDVSLLSSETEKLLEASHSPEEERRMSACKTRRKDSEEKLQSSSLWESDATRDNAQRGRRRHSSSDVTKCDARVYQTEAEYRKPHHKTQGEERGRMDSKFHLHQSDIYSKPFQADSTSSTSLASTPCLMPEDLNNSSYTHVNMAGKAKRNREHATTFPSYAVGYGGGPIRLRRGTYVHNNPYNRIPLCTGGGFPISRGTRSNSSTPSDKSCHLSPSRTPNTSSASKLRRSFQHLEMKSTEEKEKSAYSSPDVFAQISGFFGHTNRAAHNQCFKDEATYTGCGSYDTSTFFGLGQEGSFPFAPVQSRSVHPRHGVVSSPYSMSKSSPMPSSSYTSSNGAGNFAFGDEIL